MAMVVVVTFVAAGLAVILAALFRYSHRDAVTVLSVWLALLILIPARLVVPGLGALGTPANLFALGCLGWVIAGWLVPSLGFNRTPHPVRYGTLFYVCTMMLSYGLAAQRPLTGLEVSGGDRRLIGLLALVGIVFLAADGIDDKERVLALLRRLAVLVTIMAALGASQFFFQAEVLEWIRPPLLVENIEIIEGQERSLFLRPVSTAVHPIELSVVLAAVVPIALYFALRASGLARLAWWGSVLIVGAGTLLGVSRSGVLCLVVAAVVMATGMGWNRRVNLAVLGMGFVVALGIAVPGLLGTILSLFSRAQDDPSIQGRLNDLRMVSRYVSERPLTGRGLGTFNVEQYFVLDNELFRTTIEAGLIGLFGLCVFLATGLVTAARASGTVDPDTALLARALLAGISAITISMITFDTLAYQMVTGILFLMCGVAAVLWRFRQEGIVGSPDAVTRPEALPAQPHG